MKRLRYGFETGRRGDGFGQGEMEMVLDKGTRRWGDKERDEGRFEGRGTALIARNLIGQGDKEMGRQGE
jgi:hypothetical protein